MVTNTEIKNIEPIKPTVNAGDIGNVKPIVVPSQPTEDSLPNSINGLLEQMNKDAALKSEQSNKDADKVFSDTTALMRMLEGQQAEQTQLEQEKGIPEINKQISDLKALQTQQLGQYLGGVNTITGKNISKEAQSVGQTAIQRKYGIDSLLTSSLVQAKQGNLTYAQTLVKNAISAKYEPIKARLQTQQFILGQLNTKVARDEADKKALQLKQLDKQMEDEKGVQGIALEIAKNGGNPSIVKDSKNVMEAINKAGSMLSTPTTELVKIGNGAMLIDKRTGKVLNKYGSLPGSSSTSGVISPTNKYAGVVNTILASGKFSKDQANAVRTAIQNGEDPVTVIKNNAKNTMTSPTATKLEAAEGARDAFNDLTGALSAFYAAGGDTSYIKGNFEKVYNRLGKVKDPELVQLAVQVQGAIQSYRNAISGTAYSEQEGRDIASIFPGINKSEGLNNAIINGRKKLFDSTIDAAYRSSIGSAYDSLKNANVILPKENLSDRDFVEKALTKQGIKYEQIINEVPQGKIPVLDNATGEVGFLPINEFNSNYTKL